MPRKNRESAQAGKEVEDKVEGAIKILKERSSLVADYHRAFRNRGLDQEGVDFLIFLRNLLTIPPKSKKARGVWAGITRHIRISSALPP